MSEQAFRKLVSGETRGIMAGVARCVLRVLSVPYSGVMWLRNSAFDRQWKKSAQVDVPVIAIGNLTTGGTGKTPVVAAVVQILQKSGHRPGIVSRGYRADQSGENDEKRVLELLCPGVPHEQNPDRVTAARNLIATAGIDVVVLDDAFQHRRVFRDLNIVLIDATIPFGFGYQLPRGLLRESLSSLNRADLVLITRADSVTEESLQQIEATICQQHALLRDRIVRVNFHPTGLMQTTGDVGRSLESVWGQAVTVMTAIGNPDAFVATCQQIGARVVVRRYFPDHHHYTAKDVEEVRALAKNAGAPLILTTVKDMVKIPRGQCDIVAVRIQTVFESPASEQKFRDELARATKISP